MAFCHKVFSIFYSSPLSKVPIIFSFWLTFCCQEGCVGDKDWWHLRWQNCFTIQFSIISEYISLFRSQVWNYLFHDISIQFKNSDLIHHEMARARCFNQAMADFIKHFGWLFELVKSTCRIEKFHFYGNGIFWFFWSSLWLSLVYFTVKNWIYYFILT